MIKVIAILALIIVGLSSLLVLQRGKLRTAKKEHKQAIDYNLAKDDSLEYLTTKLGQETARSEVLELTNRNLSKLQTDKELAWIKEIKAINKRMNNVEEVMKTTAWAAWDFKIRLEDTLISASRPDTLSSAPVINARKFDNHDKWIRLSGYILPDTLVITPKVIVPLNSVVYWQRKKKLGLRIGKREWYKETTSLNPYVRITEDELIRVRKGKAK